jgi:hypothetical protein
MTANTADFVVEVPSPEISPVPEGESPPALEIRDKERPTYEEARAFIALEGTSNLVEVFNMPDGSQILGNEESRFVSWENAKAQRIIESAYGPHWGRAEWAGPALILRGAARWLD